MANGMSRLFAPGKMQKPSELAPSTAEPRFDSPPLTIAKGGKVEKTMHEFKTGALHSGSKKGPMVRSRKQAVAIAMSQARKAGEGGKKKS